MQRVEAGRVPWPAWVRNGCVVAEVRAEGKRARSWAVGDFEVLFSAIL